MEIYYETVCSSLAKYVLSARDHAARLAAGAAGRPSFAGRIRDSLFWLLSPYL